MGVGRLWIVVLCCCAFAVMATTSTARACGVVAQSKAGVIRAKMQSASSFVVYDDTTRVEHLVRHVSFLTSDTSFGFVMPVPTRPTVHEADASLFEALADKFPLYRPRPAESGLGSVGSSGAGGKANPVEIVAVQRIGKFVATTLFARDGAAFAAWLRDSGFNMSATSEQWIQYYVRLGFTFVAMRYSPEAHGAEDAAKLSEVTSEAFRITFTTPIPYHPYMEPMPMGRDVESRRLTVWFMSRKERRVIAGLRDVHGQVTIRSPWGWGEKYSKTADAISEALPGARAFLPKQGRWIIQTFGDTRPQRVGWGDVLFVPATRQPATALLREALDALGPVLDPTLRLTDTAETKP